MSLPSHALSLAFRLPPFSLTLSTPPAGAHFSSRHAAFLIVVRASYSFLCRLAGRLPRARAPSSSMAMADGLATSEVAALSLSLSLSLSRASRV